MNFKHLTAAAFAALLLHAQTKGPYAGWSDYGGSSDSMQYSALKRIDKSNVERLKLAWFHAGARTERPLLVQSAGGGRRDVRRRQGERDRGARCRYRPADLDAPQRRAADQSGLQLLGEQRPLRPAADLRGEQLPAGGERAHRRDHQHLRQRRPGQSSRGAWPRPEDCGRRPIGHSRPRIREPDHSRLRAGRRLRFAPGRPSRL